MKTKFLLFSFTVLALIVTACGSATPAPSTAPVAPVVPVTGPATDTPAPVTASGPAVVDVGQNAALGSFLVDSKGMSLYIFTNDTPNTSNCYGGCATAWPPLLTAGAPTPGTGVDDSKLGTTTRTDGTTQVTYEGWPLYYWKNDKAAGDTTGQNVQGVWFVINPDGKPVTGAPAAASSGGAVVNMGQSATLGSFLVDSKGMTLYLFTKDTPNTSNCYGGCATAWPPLLTSGAPTPGTGVDNSKLGTTTRTDGTTQVTYNGWPLYYWKNDKAAGDTTGQNVQGVWFVVNRDGEAVTGAPAAASSGGAAVVNMGQTAALGSFLVDSKGMTLYLFTKDTPNTSNCYGGCAEAWPPLLTTGAPIPGTGVDDSKLGTTTRTDGTTQVTYNGWPLYYWVNDKVAGDTTGEGVQNVWYVLDRDGEKK